MELKIPVINKYELAWTEEAACADRSSDLWFPPRASKAIEQRWRADALALCRSCPARRPCLAYAITHFERYGIWGGLVFKERRTLAATTCPTCRRSLGKEVVTTMILEDRQHIRCPHCDDWVEVVIPGEKHRRNGWVTR